MPRTTNALVAALALFFPLRSPFVVGLTPAMGVGAGLLTAQTAFAQTAEEWFDSGNKKYEKGDYQGAVVDFTMAIKIVPFVAGHYYNRGLAKMEIEDYKGAISDLNQALKIVPKNSYYYLDRGIAKSILGDILGAIDDCTIATQINP